MKVLKFLVLSIALFGFVGCKEKSKMEDQRSSIDNRQSSIDNHHGHGSGPHDGTVADWGGGKFHVEFIVDHDKKEGTVYILGADEKTPTPIDTAEIELSITDPVMQVTLKAAPQALDPAGKASCFIGNHEKLGVVQEYAGTISGVIDGTPYSGDFKEEPHN